MVLKKTQIRKRLMLDKKRLVFHNGLWLLVNHNILRKWLKLYKNCLIHFTYSASVADLEIVTQNYSIIVPKKLTVECLLTRVKEPNISQSSFDTYCLNLYLHGHKKLRLYEPNNSLSQNTYLYAEKLYKGQSR